jgi:hypothetical protein
MRFKREVAGTRIHNLLVFIKSASLLARWASAPN